MDTDTVAARAYAEWQLADTAARAQDAELAIAWEQHAFGGSAPSAELKFQAQHLRAIANEKLAAAVRLMCAPPVETEHRVSGHPPPSAELGRT